jgi:hypothetical protein
MRTGTHIWLARERSGTFSGRLQPKFRSVVSLLTPTCRPSQFNELQHKYTDRLRCRRLAVVLPTTMPSSQWYTTAAKNTGLNLWDNFTLFFQVTFTVIWDTTLTLYNLITPNKRVTATTWPEYIPRKETDSRSPCPALNALA